MTFLPADLYAQIERSIPIACVDFVPVRTTPDAKKQLGLIRRHSPHGEVWCHLGGRILRGETIREALRRHALDTLGVDLALPADPQPAYVYQWFPAEIRPSDGMPHGDDPRKHAIGLSFVVELAGDSEPRPQNEALDFAWVTRDPGHDKSIGMPHPLWPGTDTLLAHLPL